MGCSEKRQDNKSGLVTTSNVISIGVKAGIFSRTPNFTSWIPFTILRTGVVFVTYRGLLKNTVLGI